MLSDLILPGSSVANPCFLRTTEIPKSGILVYYIGPSRCFEIATKDIPYILGSPYERLKDYSLATAQRISVSMDGDPDSKAVKEMASMLPFLLH